MKTFGIYIAISFIAIAVFGFSGLTSHDSLFSQCVNATIPGGMPCSGEAHNLGMDILHAKIFQSFSSAILTVLALLFSLVCLYLVQAGLYGLGQMRPVSELAGVETSSSLIKHYRWMEIHQQHPARA